MRNVATFALACSLAPASLHEGVGATVPEAAASLHQGMAFDVPHRPAIVSIGGRKQLVYELHLTSFARGPLDLRSVAVLDARSGKELHRLEADRIAGALSRSPNTEKATSLANGDRVIVYLEIPLSDEPSQSLIHRVGYETNAKLLSTTAGPTEIDRRTLPVLGPPLKGGPWVAVYDPALERGHRRVVYAVAGRAVIPGRFAVDWMRPKGAGDAALGLGAEVLAVADGIVVSVRDGMAEPPPGSPRPSLTLDEAAGNYLAIDIGDGRRAFYEHLMPGILVKPGDRVRRGQLIARLGSTGQASRPHLHFHVADGETPLDAEGLPHHLDGARIVGRYASIASFGAGEAWTAEAVMPIAPSFPPPNVVVEFSDPPTAKR